MKLKTLVMLVVLAALLAGGAWWTLRKQSAATPPLVGTNVLPSFPINEVHKIQILSSGANITLAKTQGIWTVVSRFNYPAEFDKIAESLQCLSDLKVGQVLTVAESQLPQFSLLTPATNMPPELAGKTGALLQLFNNQDRMLASLLIGKHFLRQPSAGQSANPMLGMGGYPDGQYIRTGAGQVFLVAQTLDRLTENTEYWLDDEFINVPAQDIMEMTVTGPERRPIILKRAKEDDPLALENAGTDEGVVDGAKINQISGGLNHLGFDDVAAPTLTAKETGLDTPPIVVKARTKQGQLYTLCVGNTLTNDTFDRYMQASVIYESPLATKPATDEKGAEDKPEQTEEQKQREAEAKTLAEQTKALNSKLSPWTYVLKSYRAEPLLIKREDLFKRPEPPKSGEAAAGANLAPGDADPAKTSETRMPAADNKGGRNK